MAAEGQEPRADSPVERRRLQRDLVEIDDGLHVGLAGEGARALQPLGERRVLRHDLIHELRGHGVAPNDPGQVRLPAVVDHLAEVVPHRAPPPDGEAEIAIHLVEEKDRSWQAELVHELGEAANPPRRHLAFEGLVESELAQLIPRDVLAHQVAAQHLLLLVVVLKEGLKPHDGGPPKGTGLDRHPAQLFTNPIPKRGLAGLFDARLGHAFEERVEALARVALGAVRRVLQAARDLLVDQLGPVERALLGRQPHERGREALLPRDLAQAVKELGLAAAEGRLDQLERRVADALLDRAQVLVSEDVQEFAGPDVDREGAALGRLARGPHAVEDPVGEALGEVADLSHGTRSPGG